MKEELISAFVDSELGEKESEQLQNENGYELKKLVKVYRVIGESIRYNQSRIQVSAQFQDNLKEALRREYFGRLEESAKYNDSLSDSPAEVPPAKEESVV